MENNNKPKYKIPDLKLGMMIIAADDSREEVPT